MVVSFAGYVGADGFPVLAQVSAFRVQWAGVGLVLLLATGWWLHRAALPLLAVVVVSVALLLPRVTAEVPAAAPAAELRAYSANVRYDTADPEQLARSITERGADVVALPEASRRYADDLVTRLPGYDVGGGSSVSYSSASTALLVRSDLDPEFTDGPAGMTNSTVGARVRVGGQDVLVVAVHPAAPVPGAEDTWRADLAALRPSCAATTPTVLLGDLNATLDHSGLRALLGAGCADAGERTGGGLVGTWPQSAPRALGAVIDHVLVAGGVAARSYDVLDDPGSDHRALSVTLGVG